MSLISCRTRPPSTGDARLPPARGPPANPISRGISPLRLCVPPIPAPATAHPPAPALRTASARPPGSVSPAQPVLPTPLLETGPADAPYHPASAVTDPARSHRSHPGNGQPPASISLRTSTSRAPTLFLGSPGTASGVLPSCSVQFGASPHVPPQPTSCSNQTGYARLRYDSPTCSREALITCLILHVCAPASRVFFFSCLDPSL
jgi:hypothetical protein